ncbi:hypothetical protein R4K54_02370 [Brachyspira murdochii]|uniref:hypothetical protein n=1 Tax=Brachyspira murdochii TaxID=84378 RepID=UPI00019E0CAC|nr:hypothetical protein [Brachyspira murdochii]
MDINKTNKSNTDLVYQLEGRPNVASGMQYVMAIFTSNLASILIIAGASALSWADTVIIVQYAMFVSVFITFIQFCHIKLGKSRKIRANLPIVMGTYFDFIPTAKTAASIGEIK